MKSKLVRILILPAPAKEHVIRYWQSWFRQNGMQSETRTTSDGMEMYRLMTADEWTKYKSDIDIGGSRAVKS